MKSIAKKTLATAPSSHLRHPHSSVAMLVLKQALKQTRRTLILGQLCGHEATVAGVACERLVGYRNAK